MRREVFQFCFAHGDQSALFHRRATGRRVANLAVRATNRMDELAKERLAAMSAKLALPAKSHMLAEAIELILRGLGQRTLSRFAKEPTPSRVPRKHTSLKRCLPRSWLTLCCLETMYVSHSIIFPLGPSPRRLSNGP